METTRHATVKKGGVNNADAGPRPDMQIPGQNQTLRGPSDVATTSPTHGNAIDNWWVDTCRQRATDEIMHAEQSYRRAPVVMATLACLAAAFVGLWNATPWDAAESVCVAMMAMHGAFAVAWIASACQFVRMVWPVDYKHTADIKKWHEFRSEWMRRLLDGGTTLETALLLADAQTKDGMCEQWIEEQEWNAAINKRRAVALRRFMWCAMAATYAAALLGVCCAVALAR